MTLATYLTVKYAVIGIGCTATTIGIFGWAVRTYGLREATAIFGQIARELVTGRA